MINRKIKLKAVAFFLLSISLLNSTLFASSTAKQELKTPVTITGTVTSHDGKPLVGVNVLISGAQTGAVTDINGKYSIQVESVKAVLKYSYIGYLEEIIEVGQRSIIDVVLSEDILALEDIVVVGYGTKRKREITGAMSSLDSKTISNVIVTGVDQALTGKAAGVQIVQNSATPGGGSSIRIRGVGTPGVNEPLYVIDGVPVFPEDNKRVGGGSSGTVLNSINPSDIESIDILKDAASAAIYGARAANGVVLITTKQGKSGTPKVSVNYNCGVQQFENRVELLDAQGYKDFRTAKNKKFVDSPYNTNWLKEITRPASMQNLNMSVSGGNESSTHYSSAGYTKQEGIVIGTDYERFTGRFNNQSKLSKYIRFNSNLSVAYSKQNRQAENDIYNSAIGLALLQPPIIPVREPTGEYGAMGEYVTGGGFERVNPVANVETGYNRVKDFKALGNVNLEIEPIKNLVYKINAGFDKQNTSTDTYKPEIYVGIDRKKLTEANIGRYDASELIWLLENTLRYNFDLGVGHKFNLLAGATQQASRFENLSGNATGAVSNDPNLTSLSSSPAISKSVAGYFNEWALASFLGRFDYNYNDRYLLSATVRRDGSSKFMPGKQWGTFPSVSAAWNLDNEAFFKLNFVSDFKLRASWGALGNQEISEFQYLSTLANTEYVLNNNPITGIYPNRVANEMITWETSEQKNIGLDAAFLKNKITLTVDVYEKITKGILLPNVISSVYGYTNNVGESINPISNSGTVSNSGIEVSLGYKNFDNEFKWGISGNFATLHNEVIDMGGGSPIINSMNKGLYSTYTAEGTQVGAFYGKKLIGVNEDGYFNFQKTVVDGKEVDLITTIGNPIPSLTYGFNINANYKGFDLSINTYGVHGNDIYAATLYQNGNFSYFSNNQLKVIVDKAGTKAPTIKAAGSPDYAASNWFVYDGSFFRLKAVQLGYTLPEKFVAKIGIGNMRLYVSGQNLFTLDNYDVGLNPEVGAFNQNNLAAGVDEGTYPIAQSVLFGVNINF